ncbi:hypothetical protein OAI33_15040, partial [Pirellulaceae bacterium]|nr:hypothetical protein [Pirellulaceae bacterium]
MNTCRSGSIVNALKLSVVLVAFALFECCVQAAEFTPSLGVLEILADPTQQLETGFSPELTKKFQVLKQQRLEIFESLYKDNTAVEREVVSQEFRKASEQMALSLLTVSQRTRINQIQFRKDGLASLLKPEVRVAIGISVQQANAIRAHVKHRNDLVAHATAPEKIKLHQATESKLFSVLTDKQKSDWARLAGVEQQVAFL